MVADESEFVDLDAMLEAEAAELVEAARDRRHGAGQAAFEWLVHDVAEQLGVRVGRFAEIDPLALLALERRPGRRPRAGRGSRAFGADRLRRLVAAARRAGTPEPLLGFFEHAADEIESGAGPAGALALIADPKHGRPPAEGEIARAVRDDVAARAYLEARKLGDRTLEAIWKAGEALEAYDRPPDRPPRRRGGSSLESVRRALRRALRNPPTS